MKDSEFHDKMFLTEIEVVQALGLEPDHEAFEDDEEEPSGHDILAELIASGRFPPGICFAKRSQPQWPREDITAFIHLGQRLGWFEAPKK